jgi:Zn-dependent protease
MPIEKLILLLSGTMVLLGSILTIYHSPTWVYLTAFVGANLLFAGFTGFCPMVKLLRKLGFKHGQAFK